MRIRRWDWIALGVAGALMVAAYVTGKPKNPLGHLQGKVIRYYDRPLQNDTRLNGRYTLRGVTEKEILDVLRRTCPNARVTGWIEAFGDENAKERYLVGCDRNVGECTVDFVRDATWWERWVASSEDRGGAS